MKATINSSIIMVIVSLHTCLAADQYIISQQRYLKILPLYQSWAIGKGPTYSYSEFSVPIAVYIPLNRNMSINLLASQATADGDGLEKLTGISDTQVSIAYYLESYHLIFNCGINVPSGKKELELDEFGTSALLSLSYFNFQVPNFGQGMNISPGVSWALPVNDKLVLGAAASYQIKGKYKPIKAMPDDYEPGDELLLSGGIDLRLGIMTTFAADFIFTTYGKDKVGSQSVFLSGRKSGINLKFQTFINYNELLLLGQYRTKGKNSTVIGGTLQTEVEKTIPDQFELMGYYRLRVNPQIYLSLLGEWRSYLAAKSFDGLDIFGIGVAPEFSLARNVSVPIRLKYLFGDFAGGSNIAGWEAGGGLSIVF
ncbi:MAG: hypothetical protein ONB27_09405 [candidate division KSB1 bacterium]|nr:hypothetical protein [candidate division KSB1 bacterium]